MLSTAQALQQWQTMGVRLCVAAQPIVRWRVPAQPAISAPALPAAPAPTIDLEHCHTLEALAAAVHAFDGCALKQGARQTVFADGCPNARLLIIGEAPGQDEDQQGKSFVGRAGQLLTAMLRAIDYDRNHVNAAQRVLVANSVFWRPPANRKPTPAEVAQCAPFVWRLVDIVKPRLILAMGGTAASLLLNTSNGIMALRGQLMHIHRAHGAVACLPMLHPAYLLRVGAAKQNAWHDMLHAKIFLTAE